MTDIVERLRARYMDTKNMLPCELEHEAAKVIEQLRNDLHSCGPTCSRAGCVNGRLRAALQKPR